MSDSSPQHSSFPPASFRPRWTQGVTPGPVLLATVLLVGCVGRAAPDRATSDSPNILLITIDCLRADRVTSDSRREILMPNLDRLARQGTLFERVTAPAGTTFPSHATMLSGRYPRFHGLRANDHTLPADLVTAPQLLRRFGYNTGAFVSFKSMLFRGELDRGFDAVSDRFRLPGTEPIRDGHRTTEKAISWLRGADQPFFLWLHLFEPHGPYRLNDYSRPILQGKKGILSDGASMENLLEHQREILDSPEQIQVLRALYDGEVHLADELLGRILATGEVEGWLNDSVVIVTADHGQALGEQRRMGHGPILWETVLQVPLVIADLRNPVARRVSTRVGLVDLAPTILDLAKITLPRDTQGRSLLPAVRGETIDERPYMAEVELKKTSPGSWYDPAGVAVYWGPFKLVRRHGKHRLYDLTTDPGASSPLPPGQEPEIRRYLGTLAEDFLRGEVDPVQSDLRQEDLEELKSLGYLE